MRLTIGDDEFVRLAKLLNLSLLVHPVGLLVVNEEVGRAGAADPLVKNRLVGLLLKGLLLTNFMKFKLNAGRYEREAAYFAP